MKKPSNSIADFERALDYSQEQRVVFRLYVTGLTSRSVEAINGIKQLCEEYFGGRYELEVVDVYQQPELSATADLIALPTLIKEAPLPVRKLIGDFSTPHDVLARLGMDYMATHAPTHEESTLAGGGGA